MTEFTIFPPVHPGEILRAEFLEAYAMSAGQLARALGVPRTRIERVVAEKTPITSDTALRLARYFSTTPHFWLTMQARYDLAIDGARMKDDLAAIKARGEPA